MRNYNKLLLFSLIIIVLLFTVAGCSLSDKTEEYSAEQFLMDTRVKIHVYAEDKALAKEAGRSAFEEFKRIASLTDRFPEPGTPAFDESDVCRINAAAGQKPVRVSGDVLKMLELSGRYENVTQDSFDPTIGPLMDLWGFGHGNNRVPTDEQIAEILPLVDRSRITVDRNEQTVLLEKKGMSLDLGGIAKGYAAQKAVQALKEHGIERAVINAGGNIYALGKKSGSEYWKIGIQDPRNSSELLGILSLENQAAVTSGDYQRRFKEKGVVYHHLLDPNTGMPARENISVSVVCENPTEADILSTALFVIGAEDGLALTEQLEDVEAVFVTADKEILVSSGLRDTIEITPGEEYRYDPNG